MYVYNEPENERQRERLEELKDSTGCAPYIHPLGQDAEGVFHFCVATVKVFPPTSDEHHSEHIVSCKRLPDGRLIVGCQCPAGVGETHCYHVEEVVPRFHTLEAITLFQRGWLGTDAPSLCAHLKSVSTR